MNFRSSPQNLSSTQVRKLVENFTGIDIVDYTKMKLRQLISMATGYRDSNLWLDVSDCVACAAARPHLFTEPAPHYLEDRWRFKCMLRLTMEAVSKGICTTLASLFPQLIIKLQ